MIQLNLLPDVKLDYVKAQKSRRLIVSISFIVCCVAIVILVLSFIYSSIQKKQISDTNNAIQKYVAQLKGEPNINEILTVQSQLSGLNSLHSQKPAATKIINYLDEVTPVSVTINNFSWDYTSSSMTITGSAQSLQSVNQFVDILKNTTYSSSEYTGQPPAFNSVVLSSFGLSSGSNASKNNQVSYTVSFNFDPKIFNIAQNVILTVPSQIVSYFSTNQNSAIFNGQSNTGGAQ
jgi:cytoskeletal protein RodZ